MSCDLSLPRSALTLTFLVGLMAHPGLLIAVENGAAAGDGSVADGGNAVETDAAPEVRVAARTDLHDALAHVVIERNVISSQRDSLLQQRWLIVGYAVVASLLAGWLMRISLLRRSLPTAHAALKVSPSAPSSGSDSTRKSTNATITIRNATTQQPEITERVATRKLFKSKPTTQTVRTPPRQFPSPALVARQEAPSPPATASSMASPHLVSLPRPIPTRNAPATRSTPRTEVHDYAPSEQAVPRQLIGTRPSILLSSEVDEVAPSPEVDDVVPEPTDEADDTTQVRIARRAGHQLARHGLSLLEVMISLSLLATVLASISGGIYTLSSSKRSAGEEILVRDALQAWSERIMGADWEWLGRDRIDDSQLRGAWSWQRIETTAALPPGENPPLREDVADAKHDATRQLLGNARSGLQDLRFYLEYYRPVALELCFTPVDGAAAATTWRDIRDAYRMTPPIDLRQHMDAVVVRMAAAWISQDGGTRRRELVFARTQ